MELFLQIDFLCVLFAVHMDVDDVLALSEAGAVEGEQAGADGTGLICTAVDVTEAVGDEDGYSGVMVGIVVDGHKVAAVRL